MLTQKDLSAIRKIVGDEVKTEVTAQLETQLSPVKKDIKTISSNLKRLTSTVNVIARVFDKEDSRLHKRVEKIEQHLGLPRP